MHFALCLQMPGMMLGIARKDGISGITHFTTNSGLRLKNIPFCPRAHDADHVRDVQRARGSCGSLEKAQASARVYVPAAPCNRHHIASPAARPRSKLGAQEMLPNFLKDVDEQTIFDMDEEEEQEEEEEPSEQNRPPEVGVETCGEAGCPLDAEQTWSHRYLVA